MPTTTKAPRKTTAATLRRNIAANMLRRNNTGWSGDRREDPSRMVIRSAVALLRLLSR